MRLSILLPALLATANLVSGFENIIAYCDSLTDNGNDYKISNYPPGPPYYQGRFSNGFTWLEYVAQNFSTTKFVQNVGFGGATTNNKDVYSEYNGWVVPDLQQLIETIETKGTSKDLYIIYIGYNDLNSIINPQYYNVINKNYTKEKVAANVIDAVHALIEKYEAKQFLIMNVIPFYHWPVTAAQDKPRAKQLITDYNNLIQTDLKQTFNATSGIDIKFLDDNSWFEKQVKNPKALGLSTSNGPCVVTDNTTTTVCNDPETHFFFDCCHPEAKVHAAFGKWATAQIKSLYKIK